MLITVPNVSIFCWKPNSNAKATWRKKRVVSSRQPSKCVVRWGWERVVRWWSAQRYFEIIVINIFAIGCCNLCRILSVGTHFYLVIAPQPFSTHGHIHFFTIATVPFGVCVFAFFRLFGHLFRMFIVGSFVCLYVPHADRSNITKNTRNH